MSAQLQASQIKSIKDYNVTEKTLAELREKYQDVVFDVTTTKGDKAARDARLELVTLRTSLEKKRKELKAPALEYSNLIDKEAKRITASIVELEAPIDSQIRQEEQRKAEAKAEKERIERERVAAIQDRISKVMNIAGQMVSASADEIQKVVFRLEQSVPSVDQYAEFTSEADAARLHAIDTLNALLGQKREFEAKTAELEQQRKELEAERARHADEQRARDEKEASERAEREKKEAAERAEQQRIERERKDQEAQAERERAEEEARKTKEIEDMRISNATLSSAAVAALILLESEGLTNVFETRQLRFVLEQAGAL